jgi:hypothetical protein
VSLFLTGLPLWLSGFLIVIVPTALAMCGPLLIRRWVALERLTLNNEVAGFKFAVVGVIYAVLLAFAIVIAWQRYGDAEDAVVREAGAAATVYRLAAGPEPEAAATRGALGQYLRLTIQKDWPRMASESESREATQALDALYAAAVSYAQSGSRQTAVFLAMFEQLDLITQARRHQLELALGIVPVMLWIILIFGAVLTIAFTFFFGNANLRAQILMTGILSAIVFMGLLVIVSVDHPFTGPVHIASEPLQAVLDDLDHN